MDMILDKIDSNAKGKGIISESNWRIATEERIENLSGD
jgi:hypothetical protein